ncbi:glycoside hydrolase family protein [Leptolyngbya sp. FACHB-17]|uniref:glycoside hydrolase family protein n=1 Tax=unclassified Leptolyngbya TaxID=2650499 RepID=UPI0018EF9040|nr:glycoside hydrolase family protein [Leptolyngbya sp. FACHB-17]
MERSLELYSDGRLYEYEGDQAVKVTETHGQVTALSEALKFSTATTFRVASPDQSPPDVPTPRGGRRINSEGFKLLTTFEGCELEAYDDGAQVWTIGYGHTNGVYDGMTITQAQAEQFLHEDLGRFESYVEEAVQVDLNDDQFSALVCFCFNVGPGTEGFGGSTLLRKLNTGDYQGATEQFPVWNKVDGQPWLGLTRRRLAEQALFLGKPWQSFLTFEGDIPAATGTSASRTLKLTTPMMQGEDVRRVQQALLKAGLSVGDGADGWFGQATDTAVKQFQQKKGLDVDGIVGAQTLQALGL